MAETKTVNRDSHGRLIKGSVLNPGGNKHTKNIDDLIDALEHRAKQQNYKDFNAYVAKKCFEDTTVLIAVLKKIYPDKAEMPAISINLFFESVVSKAIPSRITDYVSQN